MEVSSLGSRERRRASSEAAILQAAWTLYAGVGPDGASLREVARSAGCSHALVVRYYGSKRGLVEAVGGRLVERVSHTAGLVAAADVEALFDVLRQAREHDSATRLLIRCALDDLHPGGFPECLGVGQLLAGVRRSGAGDAYLRAQWCAYGASCLLLGWVTFEGFVVSAAQLGRLGERRRDLVAASAAAHLLGLATANEPRLGARDLSVGATGASPPSEGSQSAREAILGSAIELFAAHGPASVSVRDIARHAGVNLGLVHRHFASKQDLLAEAIEQGTSSVLPAALAASGFDLDAVVHLLHHGSPAPRLIARTLVDGIDITAVRRTFPVVRSLLDTFPDIPTGAGPGDLTDPRAAVGMAAALVLGSVLWGDHVRAALGLDAEGRDAVVADLARTVLALPGARRSDRARRWPVVTSRVPPSPGRPRPHR
jgi:AcrR family transcriptional regulator